MITVIGSLKGGSGKSTVTFNLAIWLALAECDVAVIDADPQATLSDALEEAGHGNEQEEGCGPKSQTDVPGKTFARPATTGPRGQRPAALSPPEETA